MKTNFLYSTLLASLLLLTACVQQQETEVRVMTFNIRLDFPSDSLNNWKYRKDNVGKMITYYEPDIIGLQEVLHNQLTDLKERLPQYTALGVGRIDGKEEGEYCSLFFRTDRFELLKEGSYGLSETPDQFGIKGWDSACERIVTWAILKDKQNNKEIACFNTHFDHIGLVSRRESARLLLNKIEELAKGLPVIVTGDFNDTPDSEAIKTITESGVLTATETLSPVTYGPSWSFHDFGRRAMEERSLIDYVFVNDQANVVRYRNIGDVVDNGFLSDHNPILVSLTFK